MKQLTTLLLLCCFALSYGQRPAKQISNETLEAIKNDVWIPFMEAYDQSDSQKLKSIHTEDIVRVTQDQNLIETGESYLTNFGQFVESVKARGSQLGIAFAILSTAMDDGGELAYQTGYYRFSSRHGEDQDFAVRGYGQFHVGLKKENGSWKIWLDSDKHIDLPHEEFNAQEIVYELEES
ncbi:nuclear transport factor 2 family protein [Muricauda sp. CAU 1633]|uniref:YybH family protein n=1 Tax=Allomuricauda sp. CAU 1633 TaxID=2816036 RepID=UPI001A8F8A8A|nr:nuclear transport factor 2 family protein [Muricauda sp. CAU 1633]MBO0323129.1 nuclear transport factor 2 family protein [Muricauda sp. CAU 1633]